MSNRTRHLQKVRCGARAVALALFASLIAPSVATEAAELPTDERVLLDDSSQGFYNSKLGTVLDGTQPQFPCANVACGDPVINPAAEPNLGAAADILGGWLSPAPIPLSNNWSALQRIPSTWASNTETAIVYTIDAGPDGIASALGSFGVDNGVFVWVNGVYRLGAVGPGRAVPGEYVADLGNLRPGINVIQILREDHGSATGFTLRVSTARKPSVTAVPDWEMPDQTVDGDDDGLIDNYIDGNRTAEVPPDGLYRVILDGCKSSGEIGRYSWMIGTTEVANSAQCRASALLPEGEYKTKLTVSGAGGTDSAEFQLRVVDYLVVSVGDSYASGQGNPDVPFRLEGNCNPSYPATCQAVYEWKHAPCSRSAKAAPALAALALERVERHSSVTFIHLACSGATVMHGLIGPQDKNGDKQPPQLAAAAELVHGQKVDAMTMSLGGDDAHFAKIIFECARYGDCPVGQVNPDDFNNRGGRLHDVVEHALGTLPAKYAAVNDCLRGLECSFASMRLGSGDPATPKELADAVFSVKLDPGTPMLITDYPDLMTGSDGKYCDEPLFDANEFAWADSVILRGQEGGAHHYPVREGTSGGKLPPLVRRLPITSDGLNTQIARLGSLSWTPVHTYSAFHTHGYCAGATSWVRSLSESFDQQKTLEGAFHPNELGHRAIAGILTGALRSALSV